MVVFRLFEKLRYSNQRSTKFESLYQEEDQRLLRATSWYELFAPLSNLQSGVLCKVYTFVRRLHVPEKLLFVRRDCPDLVQKESYC